MSGHSSGFEGALSDKSLLKHVSGLFSIYVPAQHVAATLLAYVRQQSVVKHKTAYNTH